MKNFLFILAACLMVSLVNAAPAAQPRPQLNKKLQAAVQAAELRFRPIVMTSLAFILGCVPLAISTGAGAASRHSIGTAVVFGMLVATAVAPLFIPLFFCLFDGWKNRGSVDGTTVQAEQKTEGNKENL